MINLRINYIKLFIERYKKSRMDHVYNDISGLPNIHEIKEQQLTSKWIKLIDIDKTTHLETYNRKDYFTEIARIVLDNEVFSQGKREGAKQRNTVIKFIPSIPHEEFNKKAE